MDLNKACPKDSYPLLSIDQLVDGAFSYVLLSFVELIQGKDNIHHEKQQLLPFNLKNVGAIYQRLMDRVFSEKVGKNIEVYIDDMVVKLEKEETYREALKDIFQHF
ncbi:Retrovirus-related Pol polyprotein from transposon opus, partial [Mucuna pruriens]